MCTTHQHKLLDGPADGRFDVGRVAVTLPRTIGRRLRVRPRLPFLCLPLSLPPPPSLALTNEVRGEARGGRQRNVEVHVERPGQRDPRARTAPGRAAVLTVHVRCEERAALRVSA